jgi:hypothetical protein
MRVGQRGKFFSSALVVALLLVSAGTLIGGVENRRSGVSLPVAVDEAFAASPQL